MRRAQAHLLQHVTVPVPQLFMYTLTSFSRQHLRKLYTVKDPGVQSTLCKGCLYHVGAKKGGCEFLPKPKLCWFVPLLGPRFNPR